MSVKQSLALKKRWANVPKEERSKRASQLAKKRMDSLSPRQRKLIARKLVKAREAKRV